MNLLTTAKTAIVKKTGNASLTIKKNAPDILLGLGIVGLVATIVDSNRQTLKAEHILNRHKEDMEKIKEAIKITNEDGSTEIYDAEVIKRDKMIVYSRTVVDFVKLYARPFIMGALSIAAIVAGRNIAKRRYLGLVSAYTGLSELFKNYRKRVLEEEGEMYDRHYLYGGEIKEVIKEEIDENGKKKKVKEQELFLDENELKKMTNETTGEILFGPDSMYYDKNHNMAMTFVRSQENYLSDLKNARGHIFLNEILEALGYSHTPEGSVLGYMRDDILDFGLNRNEGAEMRNFIKYKTNNIMLHLPQPRLIWDKI